MSNGFYVTEETLEAQAEASRKAGAKRTKRVNRQPKIINYLKAHPEFVGTTSELARKVDPKHYRQAVQAICNMQARGKLYRTSEGKGPSRWSLEPFGETGSALSPESTHESITDAPTPEPATPEKPYFKFTLTNAGFKLETNERTVEVEL